MAVGNWTGFAIAASIWFLIFIVVPVVLSVLIIAIFVKRLKTLKHLLVVLMVFLLIFEGNEIRISILRENDVRNMQARIPQAIEIFQQSREQLDIFMNSRFVYNVGRVYNRGGIWFVEYRFRIATLEEGQTIGIWEHELEAMIYLLTGEELEYNFTRLQVFRATPPVSARAELFSEGDALLEITYGISGGLGVNYGYVDLGDGYILWVRRSAPSVYGDARVRAFVALLISLAFATAAIKFGTAWRKEKQEAQSAQSSE